MLPPLLPLALCFRTLQRLIKGGRHALWLLLLPWRRLLLRLLVVLAQLAADAVLAAVQLCGVPVSTLSPPAAAAAATACRLSCAATALGVVREGRH